MSQPSDGARQLRALVIPRVNQSELARQLRVTPQAVHKWVRGEALPSPDRMAELESRYGIPMRAWTEMAPEDAA